MADAVFHSFLREWQSVVAMDWSNGFLGKIKEEFRKDEWILYKILVGDMFCKWFLYSGLCVLCVIFFEKIFFYIESVL
ncbi:hypothetical protein ACT3CD_11820, partial [Geofilum sp. OHC36d9]|uniref:hypothetical protein n=1 Tax=Geofilum sp. OHC36d9 TaxID=3458413 RepID=UPI0040335B8F